MAAFDLKLTGEGQALLGSVLAGESIVFTSVQLGDSLENTGSVSSLRATLSVEKVIQDEEKVSVYATLSLSALSESFYWREVGLNAKKGENGTEILFAYGYGGSYSDYIAAENGSSEKRIVLTFFVSSDADFTAVIDESLVFPSKAEMETALTQLEKRTLTAYLCEKTGTVYALTGEGSEGITFAYFVPDADYEAGDTFTVNGISYTAETQKGEALQSKEFASGQLTAVILDHQNKTVNFKTGGVDISSATASPSDVLAGKTFFSGLSDLIQTGTMEAAVFLGSGSLTLELNWNIGMNGMYEAYVTVPAECDLVLVTYSYIDDSWVDCATRSRSGSGEYMSVRFTGNTQIRIYNDRTTDRCNYYLYNTGGKF